MDATLATHFATLRAHAARLSDTSIKQLVDADPARATGCALRVGPLYANFARQRYDGEALDALFALADAADFAGGMRRLVDGAEVNPTEHRAALHTALRSNLSRSPIATAAHDTALEALERMRDVIETLQDTPVSDIVSIGIGGSDLGPRFVVDALSPPTPGRFRVHFLSNVDGAAAQRVLATLDPKRTAAIMVSKTFGTQETLLNGAIVREWLGDDTRLLAVTANVERAAAFGIPEARILPMWDWVGGRYSLWSAVGLPIALALGMPAFEQLLAGAGEMDAHVLEAPLRENLGAWHALTALWNRNALGFASQGVFSYDERLKLLSAHLQQVVMESLGKSVHLDGTPVDTSTVPVWWGGAGTDVQHSFFQALHQGTDIIPGDFVGVTRADHPHRESHRALFANLLAQVEAFANGQGSDDPHRRYAGNRPSTLLLLDALTPRSLGALIALYEHSVYLQSLAWDINAFDQFGVELGKQLANGLLPALRGQPAEIADPVTRALLDEIQRDP
ncbi:glucose-6-phosphate isomerase [Lysobacter helvus]|uniref:Glucose-6-phosphate isomerase n=2 Tax=Lysobacteraceae TaxID=32033 RepID=A0ABN6FUH8_9GAMM|nr:MULTISPECIES: glucose-6-phosphate isomerase [Lysobacter]BCT93367.1 glucose-6-phosphate isomerase [Lysobacter caseinilyticus]BCT96520.1 glucose-6-phosphate isomerase [Lysobacter helvus]